MRSARQFIHQCIKSDVTNYFFMRLQIVFGPIVLCKLLLFPEKPDVPSWPSPSTYFLPPPNCAPTPMTNFIPTRIFGLIPFRICCNTFKEGKCFRFWELPRNSVRKLISMSYNVSRGGLRKAIIIMYM